MRADQDGLPTPLAVAEDVGELPPGEGIETRGRLVEDQKVRVVQQGLGEPEALAHPLRVVRDPLAGHLLEVE